MNPPDTIIVPILRVNLSDIPALLDVDGVNKHIAPMSRTLLYDLASRGEIQSASIGMKRGKRVFVTASVVEWVQKRMAATHRPRMGSRKSSTKNQRTEATQP